MISHLQGKITRITLSLSAILLTQSSFADQPATFFSRFSPENAKIVLQAGAFNIYQGDAQHIGIKGLIGDQFTVNHHNAQNVVLGAGYYVQGYDAALLNLMYGLNAYYFAHTTVNGNVIQEKVFTNLSYHYDITNIPIYLAVSALFKNTNGKYNITADLGIGPNIISTSHFSEGSLDGGVTVPDTAYSGNTNAVLSGTAGVGIKFYNVFGHVPLEVGYRFFYLGQGNLTKINNQFLGTLNTGYMYANALIFSINV